MVGLGFRGLGISGLGLKPPKTGSPIPFLYVQKMPYKNIFWSKV